MGTIPIKPQCNYRVEACGRTIGEGHGDVVLELYYQTEQHEIIGIEVDVGEVEGSECVTFYWNSQQYGIPEGVGIRWEFRRR